MSLQFSPLLVSRRPGNAPGGVRPCARRCARSSRRGGVEIDGAQVPRRSRRRRERRHAHDLLGVPIPRADTHGDLMSVREAVDTTSKAFATGGEDFAYYLNESRAVARSGLGAAAAAGENWADSSPP